MTLSTPWSVNSPTPLAVPAPPTAGLLPLPFSLFTASDTVATVCFAFNVKKHANITINGNNAVTKNAARHPNSIATVSA